MNVFDSMDVISTGLAAERLRLDVTSSNLANANTTRTAEGGPYQRRDPIFVTSEAPGAAFGNVMGEALSGVEVSEVISDTTEPRRVYDPSHPDAADDGYVAMPNITMVEEMVNMLNATRSYEAQLTAMHSVVDMTEKALSLGR
jgi:flagellar basal-body rod protein FlgC